MATMTLQRPRPEIRSSTTSRCTGSPTPRPRRGGCTGRMWDANPTQSAAWKTTELTLPVAITVFPEDVYRPPESWARRAYKNLIYFHEVDRGGHFAAWEQPELFAAELRAAFKPLRASNQAGQ